MATKKVSKGSNERTKKQSEPTQYTCPNCNGTYTIPSNVDCLFCAGCGFKLKQDKPKTKTRSSSRKKETTPQANPLQTGKAVVCPACSATVKAFKNDNDCEYAICEYCGTHVFMSLEAKMTYEARKAEQSRLAEEERKARLAELERIQVHKDKQKKLLDDLIDMQEAALNYDIKRISHDSLVSTINQLNKSENWHIRLRFINLFILPALVGSALYYVALLFNTWYSFAICGGVTIMIYLILALKHYQTSKNTGKDIETAERNLLSVISDLESYKEVLSRHKDIKIPKVMLKKDAYDCVLGIIVQNDYDTLSEAVSVYKYLEQQRNYEEMKAARIRLEQEERIAARLREEEAKKPAEEEGSWLGMIAGVGVGLFTAGLIGSFLDD